jgi:release factor glutamine methyltransferase
VEVLHGDLFEPVGGRRFDCIVANPPYLPTAGAGRLSAGSSAWDGGRDGRAVVDRLCRRAPAHLRPGGRLLIVHSSLTNERWTVDLLADAGLHASVVAVRTGPLGPLARACMPLRRTERIVVIEARRPAGRP